MKLVAGLLATAATCAALAAFSGAPAAAPPVDPCDPIDGNPIACENTQTGAPPDQWDIIDHDPESEDPDEEPRPDPDLEGFATAMSVNRGETIGFKISTEVSTFRIDIYRIGYYGGLGARLVAQLGTFGPDNEGELADCDTDMNVGLIDCGGWTQTASWSVPSTAVSGVYVAKLVRMSPSEDGRANHIIFVVRDDASQSKLLVQTSDPTWQSYNAWGGYSLYLGSCTPNTDDRILQPEQDGRAFKVSYNRPFAMTATPLHCTDFVYANGWFRDGLEPNAGGHGFFSTEYPIVRFLEKNGYDVSYTTGLDVGTRTNPITDPTQPTPRHAVFVSMGHDEYWSGAQRRAVETARAAGVHLAFFTGNEVYMKTRWESSIDGTSTPNRTLVTYKEAPGGLFPDPHLTEWTGLWATNAAGHDGGRPQHALTGTYWGVVDRSNRALSAPATALRSLRFWRNIDWTGIDPGDPLSPGVLGYEWDEAPDDSSTPSGLIRLSESVWDPVPLELGAGKPRWVHNLTLYRHSSGALVFSAGAANWGWALETSTRYLDASGEPHDQPASPEIRLQQASVNILADMGALPLTPAAGLDLTTPAADTVAPTIATPLTTLPASAIFDTPAAFAGTASDTGGAVAVVEASFDGGHTWKRATGTTSWTVDAPGFPAVSIKVRAIDDSGNIGEAVTQPALVTVPLCPCTFFNAVTPTIDAVATGPYELGLRFFADFPGTLRGIRFYQPTTATSSNTVRLWDGGTAALIGSVTASHSTAVGWKEIPFSPPLALAAGQSYMASYNAPDQYPGTLRYFEVPLDRGPLHATTNNGAYNVTPGNYPNQRYNGNNYWVDVVYDAKAVMQDSLKTNLVAWWPFDESSGTTLTDTASPANTGTSSGTSLQDGRFGYARAFDGVDDTITVSTTTGLNLTGGSITLNAWIRPELRPGATSVEGYVLGYATQNANFGLYSMYLQAGTIRYGFYGADGATHEYSCSPTIAPDQFSMVTFVYTMGTGGSIKCYINGREQTGTWVAGNGASTPHTSAGTQAFEIGHWFGTPSNMLPRYYFKGRIDEPIVAARAFSADEIRGLYTNSGRDATKSCHPGSANLKGAWRLNEASGTTVASETVSTNGTSTSSSNIVDGRWGKARAFGVNTGVAVGAATPLKIMWGDLTISATVLPNSENAYIAGYATSNANWGLYSIFLEQGYPSYGYYGGGVHQKYRCGVPLPVHRFSTVTFTYERGLAGGTMACYIDGEPVSGTWISGTGNSPPEDFPGSMAFEIGHWYGTTASLEKYWFDGVIDEVLVYNEKLSAAAIKASSCR